MSSRDAILERSLQSTADYNKRMEENGLTNLGEKKGRGVSNADLENDIDRMIDGQLEVFTSIRNYQSSTLYKG